MRYLVTGATGLLGNNIVRKLLSDQHSVRILSRRQQSSSLQGLDVIEHVGDIRDATEVKRAAKEVDCIIHAAADLHIGWLGYQQQHEINVTGTKHVVAAAEQADARLIYVSSVDTLAAAPSADQYISETSPSACKINCTYVVTKRKAEQFVKQRIAEGQDGVIVNPGFMLGPWDWRPSSGRMLLTVAKQFVPVAPRGGMTCCDARDVADAIIRLSQQRTGHTQYILGGENKSYLEAWQLFAAIGGRKGPRLRMGPLVRIGAGIGGDLMARVTGRESEVNSAMLRMSAMYHYYDSSLARRELNYSPRPFANSVKDAWDWFTTHGYT